MYYFESAPNMLIFLGWRFVRVNTVSFFPKCAILTVLRVLKKPGTTTSQFRVWLSLGDSDSISSSPCGSTWLFGYSSPSRLKTVI